MSSIRLRPDIGRLYFDFHYCGIRCREYSSLEDTPVNRRKMETVLKKIEAEISLGTFEYVRYFPNSKLAVRFSGAPAANTFVEATKAPMPDRVIHIGGELSNTGAAQKADYWFYLAAAFGQKLAREDRDSADWLSSRDNALDCARRAVSIDATYKERLWSISDPSSSENDLASLREDATFLRVVGRK